MQVRSSRPPPDSFFFSTQTFHCQYRFRCFTILVYKVNTESNTSIIARPISSSADQYFASPHRQGLCTLVLSLNIAVVELIVFFWLLPLIFRYFPKIFGPKEDEQLNEKATMDAFEQLTLEVICNCYTYLYVQHIRQTRVFSFY